ncbi:MAG TPA: endonuclease/exonuclease/phosphatase family protein [Gaiellaceae bacterium]|nr:endonuclease/exonuclease/phosphatase family protein [Gaiellaceae bacterium]
MLVRTWNLFHGNTHPPQRRAFLRDMVRLVSADTPDVVCLQELPVWALGYLEEWSGMQHVSAVARRPRLPLLGRWLTELDHGLFRSAFTGEADAILAAQRFRLVDARTAVVSEHGLRRIVHGVRLGGDADGGIYVANAHITGDESQLARVGEFVAEEPRVVVGGDLNLRGAGLPGFSPPLADSIDQVLVRGLPAGTPRAWPEDRRRVHGRLLSDHAPVELEVE